MSVVALQVLQGIIAALTAAPQITQLIVQTQAFVEALVTAKVITVTEQNVIMAQVNSIAALVESGTLSPGWAVEPDPE